VMFRNSCLSNPTVSLRNRNGVVRSHVKETLVYSIALLKSLAVLYTRNFAWIKDFGGET
jgi:hypothetical protein